MKKKTANTSKDVTTFNTAQQFQSITKQMDINQIKKKSLTSN